MQDSLLQLAVRRIEALEDLGLQTVWHSYRVDYQPLLILTTPGGQDSDIETKENEKITSLLLSTQN